MQPQWERRIPKWLASLLAVLYYPAAVILLLEMALRAVPGVMPVRTTERLNQEGAEYWRLRPLLKAQLTGPCWASVVETNGIGTRDLPETELALRPEAWLFAGDSLVQGLEVNNRDLFTAKLQEHFPAVAIINAGKSGSGPAEYNQFISWYLDKRVHPHFTRVFFFVYLGNDFKNLVESEYAELTAQPAAAPSPAVAASDRVAAAFDRWGQTFRSVAALRLLQLRIYFYLYGPEHFMAAEVKFFGTPAFEEASRRLAVSLAELKRLSVEYGFEPVVVTLPSVQNVIAGPGAPALDIATRAVQKAADDTGLQMWDVATEMVGYAREHQLSFPYFSFTCDGHNSPYGHQVLAELLWRRLENTRRAPAAAVVRQ